MAKKTLIPAGCARRTNISLASVAVMTLPADAPLPEGTHLLHPILTEGGHIAYIRYDAPEAPAEAEVPAEVPATAPAKRTRARAGVAEKKPREAAPAPAEAPRRAADATPVGILRAAIRKMRAHNPDAYSQLKSIRAGDLAVPADMHPEKVLTIGKGSDTPRTVFCIREGRMTPECVEAFDADLAAAK